MSFKTLVAPRINVNDLEMQVVEWCVEPWKKVEVGDGVCLLESTKAAVEIESEFAGYIFPVVALGSWVKVGEPLAHIFPQNDPAQLKQLQAAESSNSSIVITKKAQILMKEKGLTAADFPQFTSISSETVIAKLREIEANKLASGKVSRAVQLDSIKLSENSVAIWGDKNQALLAMDCFWSNKNFSPVVYVDSRDPSEEYCGVPVVNEEDLSQLCARGLKYIYAYGKDLQTHQKMVDKFEGLKLTLVSAIHPTAAISAKSKIGKGVYIGPLTVVGPLVEIGDYSRVLCGATVAHHSKLGKFVSISDGAHLGGNVTVENSSLIGIGVSINKRINVGDSVIIVSGAAVADHVPDHHIFRLGGEIVKK